MEHDYTKIKRGAVAQTGGKTRVTMYLDDDVLSHFRTVARRRGIGYQTQINATLRECMGKTSSVHQVLAGCKITVITAGESEWKQPKRPSSFGRFTTESLGDEIIRGVGT